MEKIRELKKSHVICFSIGLILIVDLLRKIIVEMLNCLEQTIIQMIATSMLGLLLTAIYLRRKNIFGVAILHTILDFMVLFMQGSFVEGYSLQYQDVDINFWESLKQSLISQSTFVIVALFVMRPSVIKKLVAVGLSEVNS